MLSITDHALTDHALTDHVVTDHLVLRTVDGAADLLLEDLRAMPSVRTTRQTSADTVECTLDGLVRDLAACPLYSAVELADLDVSLRTGLLSTLDPPIRFRVGVSDPIRRRRLVTAFEQRHGWQNAPGNWDVNLVDGCTAQFGPLSWTRRFGRPERLPWSTNLIVAEVLVRLAKIRPSHRVLDPFCGTGTILRAAQCDEPTARLIGVDHDRVALELAAHTAHEQAVHDSRLVAGRAEELPLADGCVERVVANLPFGKQVGSHRDNQRLYPAVLAELDWVLSADGRVVLLTEDKRLLRDAVQRSSFKIVRERLLRYNGASPTAYVLTRRRVHRTARSR